MMNHPASIPCQVLIRLRRRIAGKSEPETGRHMWMSEDMDELAKILAIGDVGDGFDAGIVKRGRARWPY